MHRKFGSSLLAIVALGCGGSPGGKAVTAADGKTLVKAGEAPAHKFTPQKHRSRVHESAPPPPPIVFALAIGTGPRQKPGSWLPETPR